MDKSTQDLLRQIVSRLEDIKRLIHDAITLPHTEKVSPKEHRKESADDAGNGDNKILHSLDAPVTHPAIPKGDAAGDRAKQPAKWIKEKGVEIVGIIILAIYTFGTFLQWLSIKESNRIATGNAKIAALQLEMAERPWVYVAGEEIRSPFSFDKNGARVTVRFALKNSGQSPALDAQIGAELYMPDAKRLAPENERDRMCSELMQRRRSPGQGLFPGAPPFLVDVTTNLTQKDVNAHTTTSGLALKYSPKGTLVGFPFVITCTIYYASFKPNDPPYYTGSVEYLTRVHGISVGEDNPTPTLRLEPYLWGGITAH